MAVYVRYAHKAEKLELPLATARNRIEVAELSLNQDEVLNGDVFQWNVEGLLLTNTAQAGLTLKLLVDVQLEGEKTLAVV